MFIHNNDENNALLKLDVLDTKDSIFDVLHIDANLNYFL